MLFAPSLSRSADDAPPSAGVVNDQQDEGKSLECGLAAVLADLLRTVYIDADAGVRVSVVLHISFRTLLTSPLDRKKDWK